MLGSTLSHDPLPDKRFDFQFVNPPCGYEWSKDYDAVRWQFGVILPMSGEIAA